jgi:hypothetical protein
MRIFSFSDLIEYAATFGQLAEICLRPRADMADDLRSRETGKPAGRCQVTRSGKPEEKAGCVEIAGTCGVDNLVNGFSRDRDTVCPLENDGSPG